MTNISSAVITKVLAIIIAATFVTMLYMFMGTGRSLGNDSARKVSDYTELLKSEEYRQYIGVAMSGSQVITAIENMYDEDIPVRVQTGSSSFKDFNVSGITKAEEIMIAKEKIKGSAFYIGSVTTDSRNGATTGVVFKFTT